MYFRSLSVEGERRGRAEGWGRDGGENREGGRGNDARKGRPRGTRERNKTRVSEEDRERSRKRR